MLPEDTLPSNSPSRVVQTVLILDVAEYVRLMEEDQHDTGQRWRRLVGYVQQTVLPAHDGRMVESRGDSLVLTFPRVQPALQAAFAIQRGCGIVNQDKPPKRHMLLRMGIHVGEVFVGERDVSGHAVNLAARLMTSLAGPGEIVVSVDARDQLTQALDADIEDLGERRLKNMQQTVRAYRTWPSGEPKLRARTFRSSMGDRPSIAVLPFRNLSGESTHDIFGDVIADDLIGHLSRLTDLSVISRLSTTPFRDRSFEPRNVAEVLGVRYLLTGTIQTSGNRLRLRVELTEAEAENVIWSDRFDDSLSNIFDLQDRISLAIAKRVVPFVRELEMQRARAQRPENLTAYERMLRAIDYLHRGSPQDMDRARGILEAALESDSSYAAPSAWLAYWHVRRVGQGWSPDPKHDAMEANKFADMAVQKDATDSWALAVLGLVSAYLNKDLETAIVRYDNALAINPSSAPAWVWSTSAHAWHDQGDEAVRRSQRAIELSPLDPLMYSFTSTASTAFAVAGQYEKAIEFGRRSLRENRLFTATHRILAISLALSGRVEEARQIGRELLELEPALTVSGFRRRYPGSASAHAAIFCEGLSAAGIPS